MVVAVEHCAISSASVDGVGDGRMSVVDGLREVGRSGAHSPLCTGTVGEAAAAAASPPPTKLTRARPNTAAATAAAATTTTTTYLTTRPSTLQRATAAGRLLCPWTPKRDSALPTMHPLPAASMWLSFFTMPSPQGRRRLCFCAS